MGFWRAALLRDTVVASGLGLSADIFCQCVIEKESVASIDRRRAVAVAAFSGVYVGVVCTYVYSLYPPLAALLIRSSSMKKPSSAAQTRIQGVVSTVADNLIHVPIFYIPSYFLTVGPMQGDGLVESCDNLKEQWWSTLSSCWLFWCPFMAVNFTVIPATHRVRGVAVANFCWTITIDYLTHQHAKKKKEKGDE